MEQPFASVYQQFEELYTNSISQTELLTLVAKLLQTEIAHYDWVGFYILDVAKNELVLGPFKGAPTEHTHIPVGKGICGQVAERKQKMVVQNVADQDNYLACSMEVQSEIVIPILKNGEFVAEIDIDSHDNSPFTNQDELLLEAIANRLANLF